MQTVREKAAAAAAEIHILIVDDEEGARLTLTDILEDQGYALQTAATASEALELARHHHFDIALLDIMLPDFSGTELLRRLKALQPEIACVMVSAYASVDSSIEALNEGASAYVLKPFEVPQITAVIREQAEKQRLARENERLMRTLTALQSVSDVALQTLEPDALPERLLERLVAVVGGRAGALALADEEQGAPQPLVTTGGASGEDARRALAGGRPLLLPDDEDAVRMALPLRARGETIGAVEIHARDGQRFSAADLSLASVLADRAALALENARLHARERRSTREAQTLFRVAEALVSKLHLRDRLAITAQTLAEVTACARCLIFLQGEHGLTSGIAHGITEDETAFFEEMRTDLLRLNGLVGEAIEGGRPVLIAAPDVEADSARAFLQTWHARSALVVPLVVGAQAVGAALVYTPDRPCPVTARDMRLCEAVAIQGAVAIQNAQAFERERNVAEALQKSFLPPVPARTGGLQLAARYYAALTEAQVGGDFYDIFSFPDGRIGLLMADVSGKGVAAAVHAAMGKYMLRAFAFDRADPADAVARLNVALFAYGAHEVFITMFLGIYDPAGGVMRYVNAGHPPALVVRGRDPNRAVRLGSTGAPVGAFRDASFDCDAVRIERGDMLVLYTDGVTEARSGPEFFGIERLEDVLAENAPCGPEAVADAIHAAIADFTSGFSHDDIALIIAQANA
ncbi:MAG: SpoIIE family protein phosphatase [Armatimonadetes bacterium]|nr:SpoIIE family protein phosphatase [Armatimonadota bacterium]